MWICGLPDTPLSCGRYVDFMNLHFLIIQIVTT